MNDNDFPWKVSRVILPLLIYYMVNILVQAVFGTVLIYTNILKTEAGDYEGAYTFMDRLERAVDKNVLMFSLISALIMIGILIYMMYKDELYKSISPFNFSGYGLVAFMGIFASLGLGRMFAMLPLDNIIGSYSDSRNQINQAPVSLQIIVVIIVMPVMEEMLFRGVIFNRIKKYSDKILAMYISAIIFGIYHMNLVQGIYAFFLGIVLALVYEYYKSILAPITLHICGNFTAFFMEYNGLSRFINKHLWASICAILVEIAIFVVLFAVFINGISNGEMNFKNKKSVLKKLFVRGNEFKRKNTLDIKVGDEIIDETDEIKLMEKKADEHEKI